MIFWPFPPSHREFTPPSHASKRRSFGSSCKIPPTIPRHLLPPFRKPSPHRSSQTAPYCCEASKPPPRLRRRPEESCFSIAGAPPRRGCGWRRASWAPSTHPLQPWMLIPMSWRRWSFGAKSPFVGL